MPVQPPPSCPGSSEHFRGFPMLTGYKRTEQNKKKCGNHLLYIFRKKGLRLKQQQRTFFCGKMIFFSDLQLHADMGFFKLFREGCSAAAGVPVHYVKRSRELKHQGRYAPKPPVILSNVRMKWRPAQCYCTANGIGFGWRRAVTDMLNKVAFVHFVQILWCVEKDV